MFIVLFYLFILFYYFFFLLMKNFNLNINYIISLKIFKMSLHYWRSRFFTMNGRFWLTANDISWFYSYIESNVPNRDLKFLYIYRWRFFSLFFFFFFFFFLLFSNDPSRGVFRFFLIFIHIMFCWRSWT